MPDYLGNPFYTAWIKHVCGDAIVATGLKDISAIGNIVEAIMGLCKLCIEYSQDTPQSMGMPFLTPGAARFIWAYMEDGIRRYEGYHRGNPCG